MLILSCPTRRNRKVVFAEKHPSECVHGEMQTRSEGRKGQRTARAWSDAPSGPPQPQCSLLPQERAGCSPDTPVCPTAPAVLKKDYLFISSSIMAKGFHRGLNTKRKRMSILSFLFATETPDYPVAVLRGPGSNLTTPGL